MATLLILGWLAAGCGTQPTRPATGDVGLDLQLSSADGSPTHPIVATAMVSNGSSRSVYFYIGCGCPGIGFQILGPDGEPIGLMDPCALQPLCPCGPTSLEPDSTFGRSLLFAGALYRVVSLPGTPLECAQDSARSGDYVVIARYAYSDSTRGAVSKTVERRASFHWSGS
jgi:hypothetical protein